MHSIFNYTTSTLSISFLFLSTESLAQSVAVFYPKSETQKDFFCMTEAVFNDAKASGRKLTWKLYDTENDAAGVVRATSNLDTTKFTHFLGTRTSQEAIALSKVAETFKVPFIAPIASHPDVTSKKNFSMRLVSTSMRYGALMKDFLKSNFPTDNTAIIRNQSLPFSTVYADFMAKELINGGKVAKIKTFDTFDGFQGFEDMAKAIVGDKFRLVYAPVYTVEAVSLYNALSKFGFEGSIVSQGGITDGKDFFEKGAKENDKIKVYYNGIWSGKVEGRLASKYQALKQKYCPLQQDTIRSVSAFDATTFLLWATAGSKNRGTDFISSSKDMSFPGIMGQLKWGNDGEPLRPLHIFELQRGGSKYVGAFD